MVRTRPSSLSTSFPCLLRPVPSHFLYQIPKRVSQLAPSLELRAMLGKDRNHFQHLGEMAPEERKPPSHEGANREH